MANELKRAVLAVAAGLLTVSSAAAQDLSALFGGPSAPKGAELEKLIEEAQAHPLGSEENPVRANMPQGQRAYLERLRCEDGEAPQFVRVGNFGMGVYGRIVDGYQVVCEGSEPAESMVMMDMYHPDHVENEPVPGFSLADANKK